VKKFGWPQLGVSDSEKSVLNTSEYKNSVFWLLLRHALFGRFPVADSQIGIEDTSTPPVCSDFFLVGATGMAFSWGGCPHVTLSKRQKNKKTPKISACGGCFCGDDPKSPPTHTPKKNACL
jgi:hypothetical protein